MVRIFKYISILLASQYCFLIGNDLEDFAGYWIGIESLASPSNNYQSRPTYIFLRHNDLVDNNLIYTSNSNFIYNAYLDWANHYFTYDKIENQVVFERRFMTPLGILGSQNLVYNILELVRGKSGGVYGNLISILTNLKGLPLSYNRDLQEDKSPLFSSLETSMDCIRIFTKTFESIQFNEKHIKDGLDAGFLTATDIADYLAKNNVPFRKAHNITGKIVAYCEKNNKTLSSLSLKELKRFSSSIEKDIFNFISIERSVSSKKSYGGTSKNNVRKMIAKYKKILLK